MDIVSSCLLWKSNLRLTDKAFTVIAYSLPNVAILILIERLAGRTKTFSRNFLRITVAIQIILAITSVISKYAKCRVVEALWQLSSEGGCDNKIFNYTFYAANCFTIFTDIVLAIVPIHAFWKLQMELQKKLEVTFLLGLTFLSAIFTTMKVYYIYKFFDAQDFGPGSVDLSEQRQCDPGLITELTDPVCLQITMSCQ